MLQKTAFVNTILLVLMLSSCRTTTEYIDREVIKHDSIYITTMAVDTLIQRDSIHVLDKGDTVTTTVYKYIYKVKERVDTSYIERVDTVTMTETKVEEKVVKKKDWLSIIGGMAIGFVLGLIILPILKIVRK